jgi:CubicO group peptidase (beta-lactamase class C family)
MRPIASALACLSLAAVAPAAAQPSGWPACGRVDTFPGAAWPEPDTRGWDAERLAAARTLWDSLDSAAVMVVHRGRLIASWGSVETNYTAQSVRKALLNSLLGIAVDRRLLRASDTLERLGIDDSSPALTRAERQATVRDLMMSRSGIFHSALYEVGGWTRLRRQLAERRASSPDPFAPGRYWIYNNWDFNALGTIVERAFGSPIGDLFRTMVAVPTGMQDFGSGNVEYTTRNDATEQRFQNVSDHRAYVFNISTRDLARYGLLYLNCGDWNGRRIVSRHWIMESLRGRDTRDGRGAGEQETGFGDYGYLWQIDRPGSRRHAGLPTRAPVYMASGARGHHILIAPYLDLVIVHQVATVGGVGLEAQMRRATQGSPEVSDADLERLLRAIVEAHPDARRAWRSGD